MLKSLISVAAEKTSGPEKQLTTTMPSPIDHSKVRIPELHEYKSLALTLAHAFAQDDIAMYFINTPDRTHWTESQKWDLHLQIMEYIVYAHLLDGLVTTIGADHGAVALWMPPGRNMDGWMTQLRSGMWRLQFQLSAEGRARFFTEFLPLLHDTKAEVLKERDDDSWYLVYLGTRPEARGKGYARKLVEHVTRQADADGKACYLESSSRVNVPIYERMGFEMREGIKVTRGERELDLDIMVREPKRN